MKNPLQCALLAVVVAALVVGLAPADPPKVESEKNHWSPLLAEITFKDRKVKPAQVMICGIQLGATYYSHAYVLTGDGDGKVRVWLDTIGAINNIDDRRLTVVFKDGRKRDFRHSGDFIGGDLLRVYHPNDATEKIPLVKLQEVRFLRTPRMDREKQAMFDHWRYSPFTGEKLPPVDPEK
ncbi:MAG: hypothetical protein L0Y71_13120 [Gemmataceae bacterium]|nr:hypothetical protein [Gemmataceae bacterium]